MKRKYITPDCDIIKELASFCKGTDISSAEGYLNNSETIDDELGDD